MSPISVGSTDITKVDVKTPLVSVLGAYCLFFSLFWYDYVFFAFGMPITREMFLLVGSVFCLVGIFVRINRKNFDPPVNIFWIFLFVNSISLLLQVGRGFSPKDISFALSPIIASILIMAVPPRAILTPLLITAAVSTGMQVVESITGSFFFVWQSADQGAFDEKAFLGNAGNFRAKGLFAGPTATTSFLILAYVLAPGTPLFVCLLVGSILSYGRSGQVFAVWGLFYMIFSISKEKKKEIFGILLKMSPVFALCIAGLFIFDADKILNVFDRFIQAFDSNDSTNIARLSLMSLGLDAWLSHDTLQDAILGFPRHTYIIWGSSTENSFIQLAIEYGIIGLIVYLFSVYIYVVESWRNNKPNLVLIFGLILFVNTVSALASLAFGTLFWYLLLQYQIVRVDPKIQ